MRALTLAALGIALTACVSGSVGDEPDADAGPDAAPAMCPAAADCTGRACGPDPVCGAPCGACPAQFECADGACVCAGSCVGRVCGDDGCGESCGRCAQDQVCRAGQCAARPDECPEAADCAGLECGPDPVCGESCGGCGPAVCRDGQCQCAPFCEGRECGDDGCGGVCGACPQGEICPEGQCATPPPTCPETADCAGLSCGPDPICGVSCGACDRGQLCEAGACRCLPDCAGKACGPDGCGATCGACAPGLMCDAAGQCACEPDCADRACGPDGCGGSCGDCPDGSVCTGGACGCVPDCAQAVCGDDGCGGACGDCPDGRVCTDGECGCNPRWTVDQVNFIGQAVVAEGGHVFVGGYRGEDAVVRRFDACGGQTGEVVLQLPEAGRAKVFALLIDGDSVIAAGSMGDTPDAAGQAFWARLRQANLTPVWTEPLIGSLDQPAAVRSLAHDAEGDVWMTGEVGEDAAWWGIIGDPADGSACGFTVQRAVAYGNIVRPSADGRTLIMGGRHNNGLALRLYPSDCTFEPGVPCACEAVYTPNIFPPQAAEPEARDVFEVGNTVDYFGFFTRDDRTMGYAARIDRGNGAVRPSLFWDPTPNHDAFLTALRNADGSYLVGGYQGRGVGGLNAGQAVLVNVTADLAQNGVALLGPGAVVALTRAPEGDIFVVRATEARAWLQRCTAAGDCAP